METVAGPGLLGFSTTNFKMAVTFVITEYRNN
jgi:hypothetical protein